ncbi:MAG: prolyl oligopeptidase family serine peptidase [Acidobacteriota bacterium]
MILRRSLAAVAMSLCVAGLAVAADAPPAPLAVQDVLMAPTLAAYSPPAFSPDGKLLAYVVTDNTRRHDAIDSKEVARTGLGWFGVAADIWITDLTTGERRNITGSTGHNWSPSWSPDGQMLAFLADRSGGPKLGPARLWIWERASGKLHEVESQAEIREGFTGLLWTNDHSLIVSLFPSDLGREGYAAAMEGRKAGVDPDKPPAPGTVTAKVFEFDPTAPGATPMTDQVNLDFWRRDLATIDVRSGEIHRLATSKRIGWAYLSSDRRRVAYTVETKAEKAGAGQYLYDVIVQDLPGGSPRTIAPAVRFNLYGDSFRFSPSGDRIAWRTEGPLADDDLWVASISGGAPKRIAHTTVTEHMRSRFEFGPPVWDPAGKNVLFLRDGALWRAAADGSGAASFAAPKNIELELIDARRQALFSPDGGRSAAVIATNSATKRTGFARLDLASGAVTPIFEEDKRYGGYGTEPTVSPDGSSVAYVAEDPLHPPDLYVRSGDLAQPKQASEVAPALAKRPFGRAEVIEWKSVDGDTQRGALVYPAGYEKGKRYPLIVKVYGGASISNDLNRFGYATAAVENLQVYATRGYALLLADSNLHVGTPMVDLMKSVLPGIDKAVEAGVADPDRVGVTGHSYGGYSTLCLIAQSTRFKAAVMRAGMGNMIGQYGQLAPDGTNYGLAWAESGQGRMGGSPWEFRDRYLENSPYLYLDRVKTPLLIIHGGKDDAVPPYLADEVFSGLRRLGKEVTYARYEGEGHWEGTWGTANQLDSLTRSIAWFDRHLKGDGTAKKAPGD